MLITRPNHDITTNYLYYWSIRIIEQAHKSHGKVVDLRGKRVNLKEFSSIIKKTKPSFMVINGHGDENTITGYNNEVLVRVGANETLFDDSNLREIMQLCKKTRPGFDKKRN